MDETPGAKNYTHEQSVDRKCQDCTAKRSIGYPPGAANIPN